MEETQNITYEQIDTYVLEKIPGFSEYFYQIYDDSDRELKYEVFGSLTSFFQLNYQINSQIIETIVEVIQELFLMKDKDIHELILTGFIENLLEEDREKMAHLRKVLKYEELQKALDDMYHGWYEIIW